MKNSLIFNIQKTNDFFLGIYEESRKLSNFNEKLCAHKKCILAVDVSYKLVKGSSEH